MNGYLNNKHIIQQNESLYSIAEKYKTTPENLMKLNPQIQNVKNLQIGQEIYVPFKHISLSYLFGNNSDEYEKLVGITGNSLNVVSPDFFEISDDGNLILANSDKLNKNFIDNMHSQDIKVVPFLTNNWNRNAGSKALDNIEGLTNQIVSAVNEYNLDGVNIDIENVDENYRDKYVDFTKTLKNKLPKNKTVSVAVAANPNGWNKGWHGSYDYKRLSDNSDYLVIMLYDESYNGGPQGPISSKDFFEKSIDYALSQGVPKEKIVASIPFFGRYWQTGNQPGGQGIPNKDIENLIKNYESDVFYDDETKSARAEITIQTGEQATISNQKYLEPGKYYIWYDDEKASQYKLNSIKNHDLKGIASWALGQENPEFWNRYSEILNNYFTDQKKDDVHPNQIVHTNDNVANEQNFGPNEIIKMLKESGDDREKTSNEPITRGELAVILSNILDTKINSKENNAFDDIENYWGKDYINSLSENKKMNFTGENFHPNENATKEFLAKSLDKTLNLPELKDLPKLSFKDLDPKDSSYDIISKLYYLGLIYGKSNSEFSPDSNITINDLSEILERTKKYGYMKKSS
ncbi:MAG: spore germination protein YaaH [Candidatus Improbicoccus pseudotrichonymphae]|uniref:Spore germination protein YaaH n=1 Tax=Candidatus Improbicoccus pseudotrichonymphae TaxID=3033792 RepID=A0AA48I1V1_9FIRM|nr:MAG: spore germination protein YaaH [Candidatus Improbicoccus pseudotrichonymphae]